jgi:anti-sigma-K factor RskA
LKHEVITQESQEQAALCALGALSQHDARAFESHVREGCTVCELDLNQFELTAGALALAVEPVAPPAYLRDVLTARIQREDTEQSLPAPVIPFPDRPAPSLHEPRPSSRASTSFGVLLPWAAAAALLVAFVLSLAMWRTEHRALQAEAERTRDALAGNIRLKAQLDKEAASATELAEVNSVLSSTQWRIIPLAGQEPASSSSAKIYWDIPGKRWVVTADLPPAPAGKVYQLWFVTADAKISAGLINPDAKGHGFAVVQFPSNLDQLAAAAVTLEPEGGSEQPTMPIYVMGKIS